MRVLLVYGTTEGQTRKISSVIADRLAERGHVTQVVNAAESSRAPDPRDFDATIIAASVHAGRYQSSVVRYARRHLAGINALPNAFVSVSLAAAGHDLADIAGLKRCVAEFARKTGWTPRNVHHVAGAFRYTTYGVVKRWLMKYIAYRKGAPTDTSRDYELTDWGDLTRFVDSFVGDASPSQPVPRCAESGA